MLVLSAVSSFAAKNLYVLIPTALLIGVMAIGLYAFLKNRPKPAHASVKFYVIVAVTLTVITIVEIAILPASEENWITLPQWAWLWILYVLAIVKFVMVLMFFMHLYFDKWLYTMFFMIGLMGMLATAWWTLSLIPGGPIRTPEKWEKPAGHGAAEQHGGTLGEGALAGLPAERLQGLTQVQRGALVFEALECGHCHRIDGNPIAQGAFGPPLDGLASRAGTRVPGQDAETFIRESIENPGAYVPRGFFKGMPRLREKMTDSEYEDLVRYLLSLGLGSAGDLRAA